MPAKPSDDKVFAAHQTALWQRLSKELGQMYWGVEQTYLLTSQILAQLRGNAVEVSIGGNALFLRWTSAYKFRPSRLVKFHLTDDLIKRLVELSATLLIERLDKLGCSKRQPVPARLTSRKEK